MILEKDHQCYSAAERRQIKQGIFETTNDHDYLNSEERMVGYPKAAVNKFASCIRVVDPFTFKTVDLIEFSNNEVVFSQFIS